MKFYIKFHKDKQSSNWQTESQKHSLAELKDLIDKAMFIENLNTRETEQIFKLIVADGPFDHQLKLSLTNQEYHIVENKLFSGHGSFFPELYLLFGSKPDFLYMRIEPFKAGVKKKNSEIDIEAVTGASGNSEDEIKHWNNHVSPFE